MTFKRLSLSGKALFVTTMEEEGEKEAKENKEKEKEKKEKAKSEAGGSFSKKN